MSNNNIFQHGCLVKLEISCWSGTVQLPSSVLLNGDHADVDAQSIRVQKKLAADALGKLTNLMAAARIWLRNRSLPFPLHGVAFVPSSRIEYIDNKLTEFRDEYERLADEFVAKIEDIKAAARERLGPLYSELDWPNDLRRRFSFTWRFLSIAPPDEVQLLSPEIIRKEREKFQELLRDAAEQAVTALRVRFAECVDHMVDRLTGSREGDKPKIFHDSLITNLQQFFADFQNLNITNDEELERLVTAASNAVAGVTAKDLRTDSGLRNHVAEAMGRIQEALDGMMVDRPTRRIRLSNQSQQSETQEVAHMAS